jgi:uncharacterized repeat protein (TIGR01451 family)/fimbrial isopeptide formation D2 family protein
MPRNPNSLTTPPAQRRVLLSRNLTQKIVLAVLLTVAAAIPVWLGLGRVHSAPALVASPPAPLPPTISLLDVPAEVLIGEQFTFTVKFKNNPSVVGFGPSLDLVLDGGANIPKSPGPCACDGITLVKAEMVEVNGGPIDITPPPSSQIQTSPCGATPNTNVTHPFGPFAISGIQPLTVPAGAQLVTLELPFGSFDSTQPDIVVKVTAQLSSLADYNIPLKISARSFFRYGLDPQNNPLADHPIFSDENPPGTQVTNSAQWIAQATTTPKVMTAKKEYDGPEDETATGPNFPHNYKIKVDIANGQTITNLKVHDFLPNNMQYQAGVVVKIHGILATQGSFCTAQYALTKQPPTSAPQNTPTNELEISFCSAIIGTLAPDDVTVTFKFFIPLLDANTNTVLPSDCTPATSVNGIRIEGDWVPQDRCDQIPVPPIHLVSNVTAAHVLNDKCIAIQKSAAMANDTGAAGLTPNDTVLYTLQFQVSDYKTMGNLVVNDYLSNGQTLVGPVTLTISDQFGAISGPLPAPFISQTPDLIGTANFCPAALHQPPNGTVLTFNISAAMAAIPPFAAPRLIAGIMTGGYAAGPGVLQPAIGTITFGAKVGDTFQYPVTPGDQYLDKDDPVNNCVRISGKVYQNQNRPTPINLPINIPNTVIAGATDDSNTAMLLIGDTLKKTVYAVERANALSIYSPVCGPPTGPGGTSCSNAPNPPQEVRPGDRVTYRLEKVIPSSDAENLEVEDWLPQPTYTVSTISFTNSACGIPGPGISCLGPTNSLLVTPTVMPHPATNSVNFHYGTFHDTANLPGKIDLLFTYQVTNLPFADRLFLTNEARECETNTFGVPFCQAAIAQVNLREPNLRIRKGVIATSNPHGLFSQPASPQTTPNPTAAPPPNATLSLAGISGIVNSNDLAAGLLNSDLSNVDANDTVTFAITLENLGGHPAYDNKLEEKLPACFTNLSNIVVKRGTGAVVNPLLYSLATSATGFTITSIPGAPINAYNATNGANIIVITFQARLVGDILPGCCDNVAELKHYAATPGGPDFVTAGFTPPFTDAAQVCVNPTLTKSVVSTSEVHTGPQTSATPQTPLNTPQVTIGEIVRYRLVVQWPESGAVAVQVTDALASGMKFLNDSTARIAFVANGVGIAHPFPYYMSPAFNVTGNETTLAGLTLNSAQTIPASAITVGSNCGDDPTFDMGVIRNNDNDPDLEYIVIEFNALVCNVAGNQDGTTLSNTFSVSVGGNQIATSNPINVVVVEPKVTMTKTVAPNPASKGQTLTYTVKYTNNGNADAFDVELKDTLPPGLTLGTISSGCPVTNVTANALTVTCSQIPRAPNPGSTMIFTYQALADPPNCPVTLNNQANLTWTSLPGPKGTLANSTGSSTPGNPGAVDGERDGVTPLLTLNDYATTASAAVKIDCPCNATINGLKFDDLNGNGVRDPGEPGLPNWTIKVTDSSGNTQTITTDSQGNYSITVPAPGTYTVAEVLQSGWTQTAPSSGTYTVTVSPGQVVNNRDFGNRRQNACDLEITKEVTPNPLVSGQLATATITVKNLGTGPCHGPTKVAESMPVGLTLVSASVPGGSCVVATGVCTYAPGIPAGGSVVFTYVFNVAAQPGAKLENCATLKNSEDQNPTNNSTCVPLTVSGSKLPDLIMQKKVQCGGPAIPPGICNVTLTIGNNGPGAFNGILVIQDLVTPPPSPVLSLIGSPPGWICSTGPPNNISCATTSSVSLPSGQSTTLNLSVKIPDRQYKNCASVKGFTQFPYNSTTLIQEGDSTNNESCVSMSGSVSSNCATPPAGMVAWWPLDETSGNIVHSIIGNHDGTTLPGPIGTGSLGVATAPKVGSALFFGQARAEVPDDPALNFGTGDFSIDAWVRSNQSTLLSSIVDKLDTSTTTHKGYAFFVRSGMVQLRIGDGLNTGTYQSSNTFVADGTWRHVAVTMRRMGGIPVGQFYIDGVPAGGSFQPLAINLDNSAKLLIGSFRLGNDACSCEVSLDEIELFNRVLTPAEVQSIFNAGPAGKCRTGSLTVTKTITSQSPFVPPSTAVFPTTVACLPSGPNVNFNLSAGAPTQTVNNIPVGSKCTVTEGPLPAPFGSPICASLQWTTPTYSPGQSVTITDSGAPQTVTIQNHFLCVPNPPVDRYAFTRGMNEFCIWGGGSFNSGRPIDNPVSPRLIGPAGISQTLVGNRGGERFGTVGLCYGRILSANDKVALKYTFNAIPVHVLSYSESNFIQDPQTDFFRLETTRRNIFGAGLSPIGVQLYFRPQKRVKPFVNTSGGFIFFKDPVPRLNGAQFNFTFDFGGGVQVFRDSRRAFTFGYKYQRISNGGRAANNPGFDGNVFYFGHSIFK